MPFNFSIAWPCQEKPTNSGPVLTRNQGKETNKTVAKVLEWKMMVQRVLRSILSQKGVSA